VKLGRRVQLGKQAGATLVVGDYTSIHNGCILLGDVSIGRYCLFSNNVFISSGDHFARIRPHFLIKDQDALIASRPEFAAERSQPVVIEDDCWIGWGAVLKRGVYVGKGAVIGANAVVTHDVAPYSIHAGVPSKSIGVRLDFNPPCEIEASREADWPYFYGGFHLRQEDLTTSLKSGVVHAGSDARLILQAGTWSKLQLRGNLLNGGKPLKLRITIHGRTAPLVEVSDRRFLCEVPVESSDQTMTQAGAASVLGTFTQIRIEVVGGANVPASVPLYGLARASLS
jgi:acetyltransferase-like isoleucine patch superfamily enzyme